jgi:hypothetical protein
MLTTPTGYLTAIQATERITDAYVVLDGTTYSGDSIVELYFSHGVIGDTYSVGDTPAAYLRCTLVSIDRSVVVDNKVIEPYIGVEVSGVMTYLKVGKFYIEDTDRSTNSITIHAMDKMVQLETLYTPTITTYPASLSSVIADVLSGISYSITLPSYLSSYTVPKLVNRTKRQMLGYIAALFGGFAYIDRATEQVKIKVPSKTPNTATAQTITGDTYFSFGKSDTPLTLTGVNLTDGNTVWSSGTTTGHVLTVNSPFAQSSIAASILAQITGTPMVGYSSLYIGNPALEIGDSITLVEFIDESTETTSYINVGVVEIIYRNGLSGTIKNVGEGKAKNNNPTTGDIVSRFDFLNANKITAGTIDASVVNVTNLNADNISSGTISANKISGGSLKLGGNSNGNGIVTIYDTGNTQKGTISNTGITFQNGAGQGSMFMPTGDIIPPNFEAVTYAPDGVSIDSICSFGYGEIDVTIASSSPVTSTTMDGLQIRSTTPTGTAPLVVASTTKVANLNADLLDGLDSTNFARANTSIVSNVDLNTLTTLGMYYCSDNAAAITILNNPFSSGASSSMRAFSLLVERHAGYKQMLTFYSTDDRRTFVRNAYSGTWGAWVQTMNADGSACSSTGTVATYSTTATIPKNIDIVFVSASAQWDLTLPTPSNSPTTSTVGKRITIIRTDATAFVIRVIGQINGAASAPNTTWFPVSTANRRVELVSNGTSWYTVVAGTVS